MTTEVEQDESELFWETYKPVENHLGETCIVENDGHYFGFETYGEDLAYIERMAVEKPNHVWTLIDGDEGTYITAGKRFVNRICYFVTMEPWVTGNEEFLDCAYGDDDLTDDADDQPAP